MVLLGRPHPGYRAFNLLLPCDISSFEKSANEEPPPLFFLRRHARPLLVVRRAGGKQCPLHGSFGGCTVSETCFFSPNYPSKYDSSSSCSIETNFALTLDVVAFKTENSAACSDDYLQVGTTKYCHNTGPDNVQLSAGSAIQFVSDGNAELTGFEICARSIPSQEPTMYPTLDLVSPGLPSSVPTPEPIQVPIMMPTTGPKLSFSDVNIDVMGHSGKMTISASNDVIEQTDVVVLLDSIVEVDADGNTIGNTGPNDGKHRQEPFFFFCARGDEGGGVGGGMSGNCTVDAVLLSMMHPHNLLEALPTLISCVLFTAVAHLRTPILLLESSSRHRCPASQRAL